jgi:hypothetical protein
MPGLLDAPDALADVLGRRVAAHSVIVASDALITHLGALHGTPGTVVSAGTGEIVLGTDHRRDGSPALLRKAIDLHGSVDRIIASIHNLPPPAHEARNSCPWWRKPPGRADCVAERIWFDADVRVSGCRRLAGR